MAYTNLPVQKPGSGGDTLDVTAFDIAADGMAFVNDGHVIITAEVDAAGATCTIEFVTPGTIDGNTVANKVSASLVEGVKHVFGPFKPSVYNQPSGVDAGKVRIVQSTGDATDLKLGALGLR